MNIKHEALLRNEGEYLDRDKQKFNLSQSSMDLAGDFEENKEQIVDLNPQYNKTLLSLQKENEQYMLTLNEDYIEGTDDESEEFDEVHEMIY